MAGTGRLEEIAWSIRDRIDLPAEPVVVALSGGADSAALLWLTVERGLDVRAVHVIHGLPASSLMATAAGQVAAMCGVPLDMAVVEPDGTSEEALRRARHAALSDRAGGRTILLGHTADDQAETILMRILRGTGVDGLAGIPARRGPFVRPLLTVWREETRALATAAGLPFRDDPANADRTITRNQVRLELVPILESVEPTVRRRLVDLADIAASVSTRIADRGASVAVDWRDGIARIPVGALLAAGDVSAATLARRVCARLAPPYPPSSAAVTRVLDVLHGRTAATEITPGLRVWAEGVHLFIGRRPPQSQGEDVALVAGSDLVWAGLSFRSWWVDGPAVVPLSDRALLVPEDLSSSLRIRPWTVDDRVTGRRVEHALKDAKVVAEARAVWPVVVAGGEPVWVPGVRRQVWPAHRPGRYLCVVAVQEPSWQPSEP